MSKLHFTLLALTALPSCSSVTPREQPLQVFQKDSYQHAPAWATARIQPRWWRSYDDPTLNARIHSALKNNPSLAAMAARIDKASAQAKAARAASHPRINLGLGYREGRFRELGDPIRDFAPWHGSAQFDWEIDLAGKLRAARQSATRAREATFWDLQAGRLELATKVAEAHFRLNRLAAEQELLRDSVAANSNILKNFRSRVSAGLVATTDLRRQEAEHEKLSRNLLDLQRLQGLAALELQTLIGTTRPLSATNQSLPSPKTTFSQSTSQLLKSHPQLLAAEARVRSAFQREEAARLNLLPSFSLGAGVNGGTPDLGSRFRAWEAKIGPSLNIPIYDPARRAQFEGNRATTNAASANYRATVLKVFEEVESAYLNLANRERQLASANRQVDLLKESQSLTDAKLKAGLVSQIELLESERSTLEARRAQIALRHALLTDHLAMIRALGGA